LDLLFGCFPALCLQTFGVAVMYSYGGSVGNYQYLIEVSGLKCRGLVVAGA
jgi:hypothetical protein